MTCVEKLKSSPAEARKGIERQHSEGKWPDKLTNKIIYFSLNFVF